MKKWFSDRVRLKSGGPEMRLQENCFLKKGLLQCVWSDTAGNRLEAVFHEDMLDDIEQQEYDLAERQRLIEMREEDRRMYPSAEDNPYYNSNADMDQQDPDFWDWF